MGQFFKKNFSTIILVFILILGLCLLVYPTFSDYWNSFHQSRAIASYAEKVLEIDNSKAEELIEKARQYNEKLLEGGAMKWNLTEEEVQEYEQLLDVNGTGIM
jgi:sortase A